MGKEPSGKKALDEAREGLMEWVEKGGGVSLAVFVVCMNTTAVE